MCCGVRCLHACDLNRPQVSVHEASQHQIGYLGNLTAACGSLNKRRPLQPLPSVGGLSSFCRASCARTYTSAYPPSILIVQLRFATNATTSPLISCDRESGTYDLSGLQPQEDGGRATEPHAR
jgi:hypothetical protein